MKVTLENTTRIVSLNGIYCRVWEGVTESGVKVHALIPRIAVHRDDDCSQFEAELKETKPPSDASVQAWLLRMIS